MATSEDHMRTIVGDLTIQVAVLLSANDSLREANDRLVAQNAALSVRLEKFEPKIAEIAKEASKEPKQVKHVKGVNGAESRG